MGSHNLRMEMLYHYCSNSAFHSIVTNKTIWMSSMDQSNDSQEGRVLNAAISKVLSNVPSVKRELVEGLTRAIESSARGFAFCLSEAGDLLSQWRGYADDASGVAIGFSASGLESLCKSSLLARGAKLQFPALTRVIYSQQQQEELVRPLFARLVSDSLSLSAREALSGSTYPVESKYGAKAVEVGFELLRVQYAMKSAAFQEEREWRLHCTVPVILLADCKFRVRGKTIVPYLEASISNHETPMIRRVILGPKNPTPVAVVRSMLLAAGFGEVEVVRSEASYV